MLSRGTVEAVRSDHYVFSILVIVIEEEVDELKTGEFDFECFAPFVVGLDTSVPIQ